MRICPDCNNELSDQAKFCDNCGFQLEPLEEGPTRSDEDVRSDMSSGPGLIYPPPDQASMSAAPGTCSACGYSNIPGEMFCQNCGVQLAPVVSAPPPMPTPVSTSSPDVGLEETAQDASNLEVCSHCGFSNQPGEAFCKNCGFQLAPVSHRLSSPAPVAQPPQHDERMGVDQDARSQRSCSYCGYLNKPDEKYCQNCGFELNSTEVPKDIASGQEVSPSNRTTVPSMPYFSREGLKPDEPPSQFPGKLSVVDTGAEIPLPAGKIELILGRTDPAKDAYPDVDLTQFGGEQGGVSRLHARLILQGTEVFIEDLNSTNFTFINREKLQSGQRYQLENGDEIRLGLLALEYATI